MITGRVNTHDERTVSLAFRLNFASLVMAVTMIRRE
jgi:hypothetical protein